MRSCFVAEDGGEVQVAGLWREVHSIRSAKCHVGFAPRASFAIPLSLLECAVGTLGETIRPIVTGRDTCGRWGVSYC